MGWFEIAIALFIVLSIIKKVRNFTQNQQKPPRDKQSVTVDEPAPMAASGGHVIIPPPIDDSNHAEQWALYTRSKETDQS